MQVGVCPKHREDGLTVDDCQENPFDLYALGGWAKLQRMEGTTFGHIVHQRDSVIAISGASLSSKKYLVSSSMSSGAAAAATSTG